MLEQSIQLRDAVAGDALAISTLLAELGHPTDPADVPSRLRALLDDGGTALIAVDDAGNPLGIICLAHHATLHSPGPIAYITALVISSNSRRRGVGQLLVEAAKRWARDQGCVRLSVTSAERRADAHAFYPACGLPYTGRRFATPISLDG